MLKNIVGLFVGESSKKRQIGIGAFTILSLSFLFGLVEIETYGVLVTLIGLWTGVAYNARFTKISKKVKEIKEVMDSNITNK